MSPLDRELQRTLAQRASSLTPPGDLLDGVEREARGIRRRRNSLVGTAALSVLAIAIAVPLAMRNAESGDRDPGTGFATAPPSAAPSTQAPSPATPQRSRLQWGFRGADSVGEVAGRANQAWTLDHPATESYHPLYSGTLPDRRRIEVFEAVESTRSFAVFYVEDADGSSGRIVQGLEVVDRNPQRPAQGKQSLTRLPQVSAYVDGPQDFVVIIGAPTTGQLEFSTDGRRYTTVATAEGTGIVAVTKGEDRAAYRVRVFDGDGVAVYDGPIDLLSED
ncbi:MAG TPA: hypothetical protein VNB94_13635 [Mycobacteriales bacterium]|nr:hypothetical protein [Mycobacteriales bacterium]